MSKPEEAVKRFAKNYLCSQAILTVYGPELGLDETLAFKLGEPFGAGMGRMGLTCGAVTGAFMVLGLKSDSLSERDDKSRGKTYKLVEKFVQQFIARNETLACKDLLGVDPSTDEGLKYAYDNNLFEKKCGKYVQDAAEILDELF